MDETHVKKLIDEAIKEHSKSAFHEADVHGHRRAHELLIKDFRAKQKLKEDLITKIVTGVGWFLFVAVCYAVYAAVKNELKK